MKILISGSHGLVGKALVQSLTNDGHEVVSLVRGGRTFGLAEVEWHPDQGRIDAEQLEGIRRGGPSRRREHRVWPLDRREEARDSRESRQRNIVAERNARTLSQPPSVFLSASAIGYYGDRGDELLTETSAPGKDFLSSVCVEWEDATKPAAEKGIRTVYARFGIILDREWRRAREDADAVSHGHWRQGWRWKAVDELDCA